MKVSGTTGKFEFIIDGAISEKTEIFDYKIDGATEITVDFDKMSFINSIGVKKWTLWVLKLPVTAHVSLKNCPGLIMNQIAMIQGFLPRKSTVVSLKAPYICTNCSAERSIPFTAGVEYTYASATAPSKVELPKDLKCIKCSSDMEPDFLQERFFSFLKKT